MNYVKCDSLKPIYIRDALERGEMQVFTSENEPAACEIFFRPQDPAKILIEAIVRECPKYNDALLVHRIITNKIEPEYLKIAINHIVEYVRETGYRRLIVRCVDPAMEPYLQNFSFEKMQYNEQPYHSGSNTFYASHDLRGICI